MPEKTRNEIEELEVKTDELIEKIRKSPRRTAKGAENEFQRLDNGVKTIIKRTHVSSEQANMETKQTWKDLAERARKLAKKINRSWTELVKEPKALPSDP